jgi:hypothetical protein
VTGAETGKAATDLRELVAVILLSVTAILTAWCGFQATKWAGAMSISFTQASAARIEASRLDGQANRKQTIQVALYSQWLQARANRNPAAMDYLSTRFPEPLKTAFAAWLLTSPDTNVNAPASPFAMPAYDLPELVSETAASHQAERGDNYVMLTVAFASVLFFAGMSGRVKSIGGQWALLGIAIAIFTTATLFLLWFPKRI